MHLVEQLRIKRTEAHNHLLSRKRKLSELFAATTCVGEVPTPPTNSQYLRQLQAFQDANDLQKGCLFDESTLPARNLIVYLPQHVPTKPARHGTPKLSSPADRPKSPPHPHHTASDATVDPSSRPRERPSTSTHLRNGVSDPATENALDNGSRGDVGGATEHDASVPSSIPKSSEPTSRAVHSPKSSQASAIEISHVKDISSSVLSPPPPPTTTVASIRGEEPSSPASTAGAGSSNTPIPNAGSPTTSISGEEISTGSAILDADKDNGRVIQQTRPQTPDVNIVPRVHKLSVSSVDVENMDIDPSAAFDSPVQISNVSADVQKEQATRFKPPIRINTQQDTGTPNKPPPIMNGSTDMSSTPVTKANDSMRAPSMTPVSAIDPTKRATRISSGALQKKSVSEILGGTSKSASPVVESPMSITGGEPFLFNSQRRQTDRDRKEREKSKLSTVVFAKPQRPALDGGVSESSGSNGLEIEKAGAEDRDYLYTLFESKAYASKNGNLSHLIQHAHKTITTADYLVDYEYQAQCRVLKRLYQLQSADRWALRQRKRADEPVRQTSHWDFLLDHAKWMRTDFREERKWKHAAAHALAEACAEWVASTPEERKLLQVRVRDTKIGSEPRQEDLVDVEMEDAAMVSHPTPELLQSGEDESVSDDIADPRDINFSTAPAAIFSLGANDFNFMADRTPAFDKLINELPLYEPAKIEPDLAKSNLAERLDARWKTDIVPVSRFATEPLKLKEHRSPFKRSRYDYETEPFSTQKSEPLPPRETNVGLFMPDNKHIRDRIHPGHSFRPPSEHPMPTQAFFETRASSQWTPAEDDELRKLVKDYSYNWSLISSCLTPRSLYSSSAERRTPWECFERWIGLEGMPTDMAKTPYFRTYSGRIDAANRHLQAQLEEAQRRAGTNAPIAARKRTNQPVRVDRKRAQRHLAMLDAMRKLAKKRETMRQKQQASAEMAAMRKTSEINTQQRPPLKTPAEWSAHKHEEDQKIAKRQEIYRQQLIAHQRAATAQQRAPNGGANNVPNGVPQPNGQVRGPNGVPVSMPNGHLAVPNGANRPHPGILGIPNGMPMSANMAGAKGIQAQMQANMRNGIGGSPQQVRIQEQIMRQALQNGGLPSTNNVFANGAVSSNDMDAVARSGSQQSPPANLNGTAGSPRQPGVGQALSSGHVPVLAQIAANIKRLHPDMSDDAIQRAATQQLTNWQQQQATAAAAGHTAPRPRINQAALNAARGAANAAAQASNLAAAAAAANGGYSQSQGMMTNEQLQQYRQGIRMQQAQQHAARGTQGQMQQPMMSQMSNSPVMNMSRPVSQHSNPQVINRSMTPRDPNSGIGTNNATAPSPKTNGTNPAIVNGASNQTSPPRPPSQQAMQT